MDIYSDIAERTGGDIYIGVVGPVRTGKSTFISRFMQEFILPVISDENARERAVDELPQSADGKTIMTTQPRFVPAEAVPVDFGGAKARVRLIDCVGYLVEGALGHTENEKERMVKTPWSQTELPFSRAAEIGTNKVVTEHSTVAVVVTTDGSFGEINRSGYLAAEERVVRELKELNKPFVIILNSNEPTSDRALALADALKEKYGCPVMACDVLRLSADDVNLIMGELLKRFPVRKIRIEAPQWMRRLPVSHPVIADIIKRVKEASSLVSVMSDAEKLFEGYTCDGNVRETLIETLDMGKGIVSYRIVPEERLYYRLLGEMAGVEIEDDFQLMDYITEVSKLRDKFERVGIALERAESDGFGIVAPPMEEMEFLPPEIVKQGNRYGVVMKASAPVYHIMKVEVRTEVSPMMGTEEQSRYMLSSFEDNPEELWSTNMFGKSLATVAKDGLTDKVQSIPAELQGKLRRTVGRIINEGKTGMLCLLY